MASYAQAEPQRHQHPPHPKLMAARVRQRGIDVVTAQEDGSRHLEDAPLLARAATLRPVLFRQDEDLLAVARGH